MNRSFILAFLAACPLITLTPGARADDSPANPASPSTTAGVSIVRGQFTDKVEGRLPSGDASSLAQGHVATYWVEVDNPGDATDVTLVWRLDGKEVARQSLEVGHAPRWRTWGMCSTQRARSIEVEVLDKEGHSLKTETAPLS